MDEMVIERKLAQAILDYLVVQPYGEVFELIEGLRHLRLFALEDANSELENRDKGVSR